MRLHVISPAETASIPYEAEPNGWRLVFLSGTLTRFRLVFLSRAVSIAISYIPTCLHSPQEFRALICQHSGYAGSIEQARELHKQMLINDIVLFPANARALPANFMGCPAGLQY